MKAGLHLMVACQLCGKDYRQSRSDQRFCGQRCALRSWHSRNPRPPRVASSPPEIRCKRCAKAFSPKSVRHVYCSDDCKLRTGAGKHWSLGKEYVPRSNCELCGKRFYAPPVQRRRGGGRFCSNACRTKNIGIHPELYPQTQGRRGKGGRRADLGGVYFRSMWEANYARYLNWLLRLGEIQGWDFEPETFEFPVKRGSRFYTPDFRVVEKDGRVVFHEVKGYMDPRSATKLRRMQIHHPAVELILIDQAAYYEIRDKVAGLLSGWEAA